VLHAKAQSSQRIRKLEPPRAKDAKVRYLFFQAADAVASAVEKTNACAFLCVLCAFA
jgi:hypothetical protein